MDALDYLSNLFGRGNPRQMPRHFFWDVRSMDYKTAVRADIAKQNYTTCPRHWYVDAVFVCCDCGEEFVFTADEQRFWYEEKKFYVDSFPKRCIKCRRAERTRIDLRKRYDSLITVALGQCPLETKQDVIAIINELEATEDEIPDRMKESRTQLNAQLAKRRMD